MIAAVCMLVLLAAQAPRASLAQIELNGPLSEVHVAIPGAGSMEVLLDQHLQAGERRTITVAVPLSPDVLPREVWAQSLARALEQAGGARLLQLEAPVELDLVANELRARARPRLLAQGPRLPWSALFVMGASLAILLAQRRKPLVVTAIALLAAGSVHLLARRIGAPPRSCARILEARFDAPAGEPWLNVEAARGKLAAVDLRHARLEAEPADARIRCVTRFPEEQVDLESPGSVLIRSSPFDPGMRRLTREVNAWGRFEEAWLRGADGTWTELGPWALGDALPAGRAGEPPGWLVPPLPMGMSLFLGRLAASDLPAVLAPDAAPELAAATWVRGLGL